MQENVQIFLEKPLEFPMHLHAVGCFVEKDGKILLLEQSPLKEDPGCWGIPGGKLEHGESLLDCLKREMWEETGIGLDDLSKISHLKTLYIKNPKWEFSFHLYRYPLESNFDIKLSVNEHADYRWFFLEEIPKIPMRLGGQRVIEIYRQMIK